MFLEIVQKTGYLGDADIGHFGETSAARNSLYDFKLVVTLMRSLLNVQRGRKPSPAERMPNVRKNVPTQ